MCVFQECILPSLTLLIRLVGSVSPGREGLKVTSKNSTAVCLSAGNQQNMVQFSQGLFLLQQDCSGHSDLLDLYTI